MILVITADSFPVEMFQAKPYFLFYIWSYLVNIWPARCCIIDCSFSLLEIQLKLQIKNKYILQQCWD